MGVPKFYRWLSERYPLINQKIGHDTQFLPVFDNMYLDMNGVIHNCTHPNDEEISESLSLKEMIVGMFSYVDRMVQIVKPQKVLMLAVDGCAPRAKMNQQRSRRFASAKDRREATEAALLKGDITEDDAKNQFDSNCITPGTEFMDIVSQNFQYFIQKKIKEDPLWQNLTVIYSGHDVPGEGEHKIMDYIRHTRMQPGYEPNTRHCLCGLDADLIMLGLASHEPHFALLREVVDFNAFRNKKNKNSTKEVKKQVSQDKWQLLHVSTLRQYLDLEYRNVANTLPFKYDLECIIDDWVLMVMLVGNDFLPHLPSLDISEGALDEMAELYRDLLPTLGGYITDNGTLHMGRLEQLLRKLGEKEDSVFKKRVQSKKKNNRRSRAEVVAAAQAGGNLEDVENQTLGNQNESTAERFKRNYYLEKFGIDDDNKEIITTIRNSYIEGLQWCFQYYYQGVASWDWFFPFHYAPFASDLVDLATIPIDLQLGKPFTPFLQLLSCLPSDSAWCLPQCYRNLMIKENSPIIDFYPNEFKVDMNGKRNPWEGVNLLPFIDQKRLNDAVHELCPDTLLSEQEIRRNKHGIDLIFQFDPSVTTTAHSPLPNAGLKDIPCCQTSVKQYKLPAMEKFSPKLLAGTVAGEPWAGDPQLMSLQLSSSTGLAKCQLNCFGRASHKDTLVLRLMHRDFPISDNLLQHAIDTLSVIAPRSSKQAGPTVFVNYPHLHEALVVSVATKDMEYTFSMVDGVVPNEDKTIYWNTVGGPHKNGDRVKEFQRDAILSKNKLLEGAELVGTGGLDIGTVEAMLLVRPLIGVETNPEDGSCIQIFGEETTWIPYQLAVLSNPAPDMRFLPKGKVPLIERFPNGAKVICLGKKGYGQVGIVESVKKNVVQCQFPALSPELPPFGHTIAKSVTEKYMSAKVACKMLGVNMITLGKIMGSLKVCPGRLDIGLNLRVGREYRIQGYARSKSTTATQATWSTGNTPMLVNGLQHLPTADNKAVAEASVSAMWEYTDKAIELALAYKKKFPHVFSIVQQNPNEREYPREMLFGKGNEGEVNKVLKWLEQLDTFALPLIPVSSKCMSKEAVLAVQNAADNIMKQKGEQELADKFVTVGLPATMLFRCKNDLFELGKSPTSDVRPKLGDRVENLCNPMVPFGLRGTVVATHATTGCVEVLFDTEFVGGTTLYGQCSSGRGKLLPWSQVLNLSRRSPVKAKTSNTVTTETSQPVKPITILKPGEILQESNYVTSNNALKRKVKETDILKPRLLAPPPKPKQPVNEVTEVVQSLEDLAFENQEQFRATDDLAKFWEELQGEDTSAGKTDDDELLVLLAQMDEESNKKKIENKKKKEANAQRKKKQQELLKQQQQELLKQQEAAKQQEIVNQQNKSQNVPTEEPSEHLQNLLTKAFGAAGAKQTADGLKDTKSSTKLARPPSSKDLNQNIQILQPPPNQMQQFPHQPIALAHPPRPYQMAPPNPLLAHPVIPNAFPPNMVGYPMHQAPPNAPPPVVDAKLDQLQSLISRAQKTAKKPTLVSNGQTPPQLN